MDADCKPADAKTKLRHRTLGSKRNPSGRPQPRTASMSSLAAIESPGALGVTSSDNTGVRGQGSDNDMGLVTKVFMCPSGFSSEASPVDEN